MMFFSSKLECSGNQNYKQCFMHVTMAENYCLDEILAFLMVKAPESRSVKFTSFTIGIYLMQGFRRMLVIYWFWGILFSTRYLIVNPLHACYLCLQSLMTGLINDTPFYLSAR